MGTACLLSFTTPHHTADIYPAHSHGWSKTRINVSQDGRQEADGLSALQEASVLIITHPLFAF